MENFLQIGLSLKKYFIIIPVILSIFVNIYRYTDISKGYNMMNDEREYEAIAKSIMKGESTTDFYINEYSTNQNDIGLLVTPVYPAFIALAYLCFGPNPVNVFFMQVVMNVLILIIFYSILKKHISDVIACVVTSLLSIYYPLWAYNFTLMMEIPSIFILIIIIWITDKFLTSNSLKFLLLLSLLWGLLIFLNNRFIVHYFLFVVFLLFTLRKHFNIALKRIAFSLLIVFLVLLPWHIRQYIVYNELIIFTPLRAGSILNKEFMKDNVRVGKTEPTEFPDYNGFLNKVANYDKQSEDEKMTIKAKYSKDVYNKIKSKWENRNPLWVYRLFENFRIFRSELSIFRGTNVVRFTGSYGRRMNILNSFTILPAFILLPFGIYFSIKRKTYLFQIIGVIISSNIILLMIYNIVVERYTYLVLPLVFILATYGFWEFNNSIKKFLNKSLTK
jgi:4-amino-4-deoxy-L-arabinose transferase-like glycosyltransferase